MKPLLHPYGWLLFLLLPGTMLLIITQPRVAGDPAGQPRVVTFEEFGAKGAGDDETKEMLAAFAYAKENKLAIKLQGKRYKFSPRSTVDLTGIPAFTGTGTIDLADVGANAGNKSMVFVFDIKGSKALSQGNVTGIVKGKQSVNIQKGLALSAGDIVFITSAEALPNDRRPYNCKGQRARVSTYNQSTGALVVDEPFFYDIGKAWLWKNDYQPSFRVDSAVRFITSPMNFLGCFQLVYANATMSGYYENFALAAISYRSSSGECRNVRSNLPVTSNNGYSIGISIADLSKTIVRDCSMKGGRHTVSGTGGGLWRKSESGGPDESAGYPSDVEIDGGTYYGTNDVRDISEDNCTIDSHGNVHSMKVRNCTVYGGFNLGADYGSVEHVVIYTDKKRAFNFGSDVKPGSPWGHYLVKNVRIIIDKGNTKAILYSKSDVQEIRLDSVMIEGNDDNTLLADFRYPAPKKIVLDNLHWNSDKISKPPRFLVHSQTDFQVTRSAIMKEEVRIIP